MGFTIFKINTNTGRTFLLDYSDPTKYAHIIARLKSVEFQRTITAVSIVRPCGKGTKCPVCDRRAIVVCDDCGEAEDAHCDMGVQYSLPRPKKYDRVFFVLETIEPDSNTKGYDRIQCFADEVQIIATVHKSQPSVCVVLHKLGIQRYNPFEA